MIDNPQVNDEHDVDELVDDDLIPTPWFEHQPDHPQLPHPKDDACIVVVFP